MSSSSLRRWLLEDYSFCKAGLAKGCNLTATESALVEMVTAGARSRSLLGWYTCVRQRALADSAAAA